VADSPSPPTVVVERSSRAEDASRVAIVCTLEPSAFSTTASVAVRLNRFADQAGPVASNV
jgi:hypothetical protein